MAAAVAEQWSPPFLASGLVAMAAKDLVAAPCRSVAPRSDSEPEAEPAPINQAVSTGRRHRSATVVRRETLTIFDWDDTLLCTNFIALQCSDDQTHFSPAMQRRFREIEEAALQVLEAALSRGHVAIVTSALEGWVEASAARYLPGLVPTLRNIPIVSARSMYEELYPSEAEKWKQLAFLYLHAELQLDPLLDLNLVVLGDSEQEIDAARVMGKKFEGTWTKTVKFCRNPSPELLCKELKTVVKKFEKIVGASKDLTISLERN